MGYIGYMTRGGPGHRVIHSNSWLDIGISRFMLGCFKFEQAVSAAHHGTPLIKHFHDPTSKRNLQHACKDNFVQYILSIPELVTAGPILGKLLRH